MLFILEIGVQWCGGERGPPNLAVQRRYLRRIDLEIFGATAAAGKEKERGRAVSIHPVL